MNTLEKCPYFVNCEGLALECKSPIPETLMLQTFKSKTAISTHKGKYCDKDWLFCPYAQLMIGVIYFYG